MLDFHRSIPLFELSQSIYFYDHFGVNSLQKSYYFVFTVSKFLRILMKVFYDYSVNSQRDSIPLCRVCKIGYMNKNIVEIYMGSKWMFARNLCSITLNKWWCNK